VPASASSLIAVLAACTGPVSPGLGSGQDGDLLVALHAVPDPRQQRGRRHRLVTVLAVSVAAVLAGARSYVAITEWAHDLPVSARVRLGIGRRAPSESTIRRILQSVDLDALDTVLSAWLAARLPAAPMRRAGSIARVVAVDGKTARGARRPDGSAVHLLAAFDQASGVVLGQTAVERKPNEVTAFAPLLDRLDLTDVLVTADALHTHRGHAKYLHARGGHYLWIVKANQPRLHAQLLALPWQQIPVVDERGDRGHGRVETRRVKLTAVGAGIGFPHARLAIQLQRRRPRPDPAPGRARRSMQSPACTGDRPAPTWSPRRSAGTGGSSRCTGSVTCPSARTCPRSGPATGRRSWPAYATPPSVVTAWPAPRRS
jgi:predicted transposase YbfD/YdcC